MVPKLAADKLYLRKLAMLLTLPSPSHGICPPSLTHLAFSRINAATLLLSSTEVTSFISLPLISLLHTDWTGNRIKKTYCSLRSIFDVVHREFDLCHLIDKRVLEKGNAA